VISVRNDDNTRSADSTTLDEGRFELDVSLRGAAVLQALHHEDFTAVVYRQLAVGGDTDLGDIVVRQRRRWGGRVVDTAGSPVAGAVIHAEDRGKREFGATTTRPDGTFDFLLAPEVPVRFTVSRRGFAPRIVEAVSCTDPPPRVLLEPE